MNHLHQTRSPFPAGLRDAYLRGFPQRLEQLKQAIRTADFAAAARIGHQLKGSGLSYGFPEITQLGSQLEEAGRQCLIQRLCVLEKELASEFARMSGQSEAPEIA